MPVLPMRSPFLKSFSEAGGLWEASSSGLPSWEQESLELCRLLELAVFQFLDVVDHVM